MTQEASLQTRVRYEEVWRCSVSVYVWIIRWKKCIHTNMLCGMFDWNESCLVQWFWGLKSLYFNVTSLVECFVFCCCENECILQLHIFRFLAEVHVTTFEWTWMAFIQSVCFEIKTADGKIVVTVKTFDFICSAFGDYRYKLYVVEKFNFKAHFQSKFYRWIIINYKKKSLRHYWNSWFKSTPSCMFWL